MKWKLTAIMAVLMTGLVAVLTYTQITSQKDMLKNELDKRIALMKENLVERGKSFTANLVTEAENDIASFNFSGAMERIRSRAENNAEIKYAVFLNPDGEIALSLKYKAEDKTRTEKKEMPARKNYQTSNYERMTIEEYREADGDVIEIVNSIQIGAKASGTLKLVFTLKHLDREIEKTGKQIREDMNKVVVTSTLTSLGFMGICFVFMFFMAAKASKPLILLTDFARKLSKGDFSASSDIRIRSTDEVGVLAVTFIEMSRKLKESYSKLEEYNRTLEQKVAERTEEIAQKNIRLNEAIKDIEAARKEAETANRAKGDFLANMSHEIRTPMNAIIGMTGLALKKEMSQIVRNYLNTVQTSAHSLLGLINDILDFSKIEAGRLELESVEFRLCDLMDNLCDMFSGKVSAKEIELIVSADTDVPCTLIGDPLRLGQILINLVNNAVKFTDQGEILVRTERLEEDTETVFLRFSVKDTGIGISSDKLGRLFTPFTQVNGSFSRKFGGTGLGLSISRRLAEMMGGKIGVSSEPDRGSTFYFTARLGLKAEAEESKPVLPADLGGMNVLIADDNETFRNILGKRLEFLGFNVSIAASGKEALEKLGNPALSCDLLMIDHKMPGLSGIEVVKTIRNEKRLADIPIILMADIGNEEVLQFMETGLVKTLAVKPLKQSLLPDIVMDLFGYTVDRVSDCKPRSEKEAEAIAKIRGAKILLAEDNFINQQVAVEILQSIGIVAEIVENGRQAVEALTGPGMQAYDAVLMDIQMPEMDGFEATEMIRKWESQPGNSKSVPIIAMTAHAMKGDKERCLDSGMDDYVSKPIDTSELFSVLSRWIKPKSADNRAEDAGDRRQHSAATDNIQASVSDFPESLPGIHIESALDRLRGSKKVFLKILDDFKETYADVAKDIRAALKKGDIEAARRINHTLKGVAGNFSATDLYAAAVRLETAIKENRSEDFDALLKILEEALSVVLRSAESLKHTSGDESPEISEPEGRQLKEMIAELSEMLSRNNPKSSACLDALKEHPDAAAIQKELDFLKKQIKKFDFKGAGKTLDEIAASMKK